MPPFPPCLAAAGHTSFGEQDGKNGTAAERLVFLCCSGPSQTFAGRLPYLFGIHTNSDLYTEQLLKSAKLSKQFSSVAVFYNREIPFTNLTCTQAIRFAEEFDIKVVQLPQTYNTSQATDKAVFQDFATRLKEVRMELGHATVWLIPKGRYSFEHVSFIFCRWAQTW